MSEMKNCTVMVAGGAGFVGSAIVRELLDKGLRVVCFDNYMHGVPANVEGLEGALFLVQGSALETWKLADTIKQYDVEYIIDCIGDTYVPSAYEMPQRFFENNLQSTFNLLMATKISGVKRMLYVSSTEVYGQHDRPTRTPSPSSPPTASASPSTSSTRFRSSRPASSIATGRARHTLTSSPS